MSCRPICPYSEFVRIGDSSTRPSLHLPATSVMGDAFGWLAIYNDAALAKRKSANSRAGHVKEKSSAHQWPWIVTRMFRCLGPKN